MRATLPWSRQRACREFAWETLFQGDLDGDGDTERLSEHLTHCTRCQRKLTDLAADQRWWLDAGRWLEPLSDEFESEDSEDTSPSSTESIADELIRAGVMTAPPEPGPMGRVGRYTVKRVLGMGGTGIVLQAADPELNRTVAIKVLAPSLAASGAARRRFAREGQAVAAIAHDNVVSVHHVEVGGRIPYLVMQYIDGSSLQDFVTAQGPLDVTTALRIAAQIAAGLDAAHAQGLVHRDVKPANILVGASGQRVWITDFGLARAVDDASLTRTGFIAGTPHYMSPEQARGEAVRGRSDLFGLGSVVYFMLTGRPPFRADRTLAILNRICNEPHRDVREVNPDVPPPVAGFVDRLLQKEDGARYASAADVREACLGLLTNANEVPEVSVPTTPRTRRLFGAEQIVVCLVLLLGIGLAAAWWPDRHSLSAPRVVQPVDDSAVVAEQVADVKGRDWSNAPSSEYGMVFPPPADEPYQPPSIGEPMEYQPAFTDSTPTTTFGDSSGDLYAADAASVTATSGATLPAETAETTESRYGSPPNTRPLPVTADQRQAASDRWLADLRSFESELQTLRQSLDTRRDAAHAITWPHTSPDFFPTARAIELGLQELEISRRISSPPSPITTDLP